MYFKCLFERVAQCIANYDGVSLTRIETIAPVSIVIIELLDRVQTYQLWTKRSSNDDGYDFKPWMVLLRINLYHVSACYRYIFVVVFTTITKQVERINMILVGTNMNFRVVFVYELTGIPRGNPPNWPDGQTDHSTRQQTRVATTTTATTTTTTMNVLPSELMFMATV